ncbi:MAG: hypothetical protein II921_02860 [Treponema sp.]|nr:hypothetical protein [Treponema sp.]
METKTDGRGGARKGAGRPKMAESDKVKYERHTIVFKPEDWEAVSLLAKRAGKTVSRYIVDTVLGKEPVE